MSVVGINLSEEEISKMKKQQFKKIVLSHVRTAALKYLKQLQEKHSKLDGIKYDKLELQNYLTSPLFNNESRNLLVRLRTRTVSGVRSDFGGLYADTNCPLGCGERDTIPNILRCNILLKYYTSSEISIGSAKYEDIFSQDVLKQKQVTELYRQLLQIRNQLISQPETITGPVHSSNTLQSISSDITYGN